MINEPLLGNILETRNTFQWYCSDDTGIEVCAWNIINIIYTSIIKNDEIRVFHISQMHTILIFVAKFTIFSWHVGMF